METPRPFFELDPKALEYIEKSDLTPEQLQSLHEYFVALAHILATFVEPAEVQHFPPIAAAKDQVTAAYQQLDSHINLNQGKGIDIGRIVVKPMMSWANKQIERADFVRPIRPQRQLEEFSQVVADRLAQMSATTETASATARRGEVAGGGIFERIRMQVAQLFEASK